MFSSQQSRSSFLVDLCPPGQPARICPPVAVQALFVVAIVLGALTPLQLAWADEEVVWGPVEIAATREPGDSGAITDFRAGDFRGARFDLVGVNELEVSVKLRPFPDFDPETTTVYAQVREDTWPYDIVEGWEAEIELYEVTSLHRGYWFSTVLVNSGHQLNGTYWVGVECDPSNSDLAVGIYFDWEPTLTWDPDPNSQQGYVEQDGLWLLTGSGLSNADHFDPLINIRQGRGWNIVPTATITSVTPNPAIAGQAISFSGTGTDPDGSITGYKWKLADGTILSESSSFTRDFLKQGSYDICFQVKDDAGSWSEWVTTRLVVAPADPPTIGGLQDAGGKDQLGMFISGMHDDLVVTNTYSVAVEEGDFAAAHVVFQITMGGFSREVDTTTEEGGRWYATLTVSDLSPGTYTVSATAYDEFENPSETVSDTFRMIDPPPWWGANWVADQSVRYDSDTRQYSFAGWIPQYVDGSGNVFRYYYAIEPPLEFPFLGELENSAGLALDIDESFLATGAWTHAASGGVSATLMGQRIFDQPFDVTHASDHYTWSWTSPTLLDFKTNIYDGILFTGTVGPVYYRILLSVDMGLEADLAISGDIAANLQPENICITPGVTGWVSFDAAADIFYGAATVGVIGTPELEFELPVCYTHPDGEPPDGVYLPGPCITLRLLVEAYVEACWGWYRWESGQYEMGSVSWGEGCDAKGRDSTRGAGPGTLFQSPRIASDGAGNAVCIWIHDNSPAGSAPDPDVYYAYFSNATGAWTTPAPVATTDLFETDPRVVFTAPGQALLVVTQNRLDRESCESAEPTEEFNALEVIFNEQELISYRFNGTAWLPCGPVYDDPNGVDSGARCDGRCELAAGPGGTALVVWVRDRDGHTPSEAAPGLDTAIYAARWTGSGWTPPQVLAQGAGAYVEPDVAYDLWAAGAGSGKAVAVWVADQDGDLYSNSDRSIEYAYFDPNSAGDPNSTGWMFPGSPVVTGMPGLLWPTVYFDMYGHPVVVFTQRGSNDSGKLPSGCDYGEGVDDYLFSASCTWDSSPFPFSFDQINPIGGPYQNRARWPRATVCTALPEPMAFVGCRSFKGIGDDGYDGELGITMKKLEDWTPHGALPSPVVYTDDKELDWQVDIDADNSVGMLRAVWVRPSTSNPDAAFGDGFDSIRLLEIPLGRDLSVCDGNISLSQPYPQNGETVTISAHVRNAGVEELYSSVAVDFYLDEVSPAAKIGTGHIPPPFRFQWLKTASIDWVADGLDHEIIVVVDPADSISELNEENNEARLEISAIDPPENLRLVEEPATMSMILSWSPPSDPANPAISVYRVYRDIGEGFELLAETTSTVYTDDTTPIGTYQVTAVSEGGSESVPAGPVSGVLDTILYNGILKARLTDYGTSGRRLPHAEEIPAEIAWLPISHASQAWSWEGNLHYDQGGGAVNHLMADPDEFTVTQPLEFEGVALASQSQNDEFSIVATHSLAGSTLTTQLQVTNISGGALSDVRFAWMLDADLALAETDPRMPCCPSFPWLGFGTGQWFEQEGRGVQTNLNLCAGVLPAEIAAVFEARMDDQIMPDEWTVGNPVGFQGSTCAFDGPSEAEPAYMFQQPFNNVTGCVGLDQDLAMVASFTIDQWPPGTTHTFTYTLTFEEPDESDLDGDGIGDGCDNCPHDHNAGQEDCDGDGRGDVCTIAECDGSPWCSDCNRNGIPDGCDIAGGVSADANGNGIPDECECYGDLDGDADVDLADLAQLLAHYGMTSGAAYEDGDLDGDGDVDLTDLAVLLAVYGTACP